MFKNLKVDYLAVMSAAEINWYKKNLLESGRVLVCGSVKNNKIIYLPHFKDSTFEAGTKIFTKYYNIDNPENSIAYYDLYDINQPIKILSHSVDLSLKIVFRINFNCN